jgi:hypothetical protein
MDDVIKISTLVGHSQVETAIKCLGSLKRFCQNPHTYNIHDDGTLTDLDKSRLDELLHNTTYINRSYADSIILNKLKKYPHCYKYRQNHPWALKLFDICLLGDQKDDIYFSDSDILFLRPFLLPYGMKDNSITFMQDSSECYSILPWHLHPIGPWKIVSRANTGLILARKSALDLDYLEKFLSNQRLSYIISKRPNWVEQTCWSLLAAQNGGFVLDSSQVCVATRQMSFPIDQNKIAIHFVSSYRKNLSRFTFRAIDNKKSSEVLRKTKGRLASPLGLLKSELERRIKMYLSKLS